MEFFKRIRDVLQEDQPEHDVLVLRRIDILPQLVGRLPELLLEGFLLLRFRSFRFGGFGHGVV
ncbi:hypothetical protein D3C83_318640 [compost metagenome]